MKKLNSHVESEQMNPAQYYAVETAHALTNTLTHELTTGWK